MWAKSDAEWLYLRCVQRLDRADDEKKVCAQSGRQSGSSDRRNQGICCRDVKYL